AADRLLMPAAAAQIARPTLRARCLAMDVAFRQPARLSVTIDGSKSSHRAFGVADEAVARRQLAISGHTEIAGTGAARVGPMGTTMDLAHRIDHVLEWIALARDEPPLERAAALDHAVQHAYEILAPQFAAAAGGAQHRGEADAVKSHANEFVEGPAQVEIVGRHGDACRDLHTALARQQRPQIAHDAIEAARAAFVRPETIMRLAQTVEADRNGKAIGFEERRIRFVEQCAVGRDREAERDAALAG